MVKQSRTVGKLKNLVFVRVGFNAENMVTWEDEIQKPQRR